MNRLKIPTDWGVLYANPSEDTYTPGIHVGITLVNPKTGAACDFPIMLLQIKTDGAMPTLETNTWPITADADAFWDNPQNTESIALADFIRNQFSDD